MTVFEQQLSKIQTQPGFIAALDQSGGSTPKALEAYGIDTSAYANEQQMFDMVHAMRSRIITSPAFDGAKILGAILFENTLDRTVQNLASSDYLWQQKNIVPFLKIDKGLAEKVGGVQLMKPIPELQTLLAKAKAQQVFGTKMRSVIWEANESGIQAIVAQQFAFAEQIIAAGLVPIIEPEVNIDSPQKTEAEAILIRELMAHLNQLKNGQKVMLKLTLPEKANLYNETIDHSNVVRVVALSGGYTLDMACDKLAQNHNMVASFSRVLTNGLFADQTDEAFNKTLTQTIDRIYQASLR